MFYRSADRLSIECFYSLSLSLSSSVLVAVDIFDSGSSQRQLHNRDRARRECGGESTGISLRRVNSLLHSTLSVSSLFCTSFPLSLSLTLSLSICLLQATDATVLVASRRVAPHAIGCTGDDNAPSVAPRFSTLKESWHAHRSVLCKGINFNHGETTTTTHCRHRRLRSPALHSSLIRDLSRFSTNV